MKIDNEPNTIKAIYLVKQALACVETLDSANMAVDTFREKSFEIKALNLKNYNIFNPVIDLTYVNKDKRGLRQVIISSLKACRWLGSMHGARSLALLKYLQANSNNVPELNDSEFLNLKALHLIEERNKTREKNRKNPITDTEFDAKLKQLENNLKLHFLYKHNRN